jgi:coenzyme Q-binding protein COQ10
LPWVIDAKISGRQDRTIWMEMTMATILLRKRFTTTTLLDRPHRMEINSYDPMFERFEQIWTFVPAAEGGTNVEYRVDLIRILLGAPQDGIAPTTRMRRT